MQIVTIKHLVIKTQQISKLICTRCYFSWSFLMSWRFINFNFSFYFTSCAFFACNSSFSFISFCSLWYSLTKAFLSSVGSLTFCTFCLYSVLDVSSLSSCMFVSYVFFCSSIKISSTISALLSNSYKSYLMWFISIDGYFFFSSFILWLVWLLYYWYGLVGNKLNFVFLNSFSLDCAYLWENS